MTWGDLKAKLDKLSPEQLTAFVAIHHVAEAAWTNGQNGSVRFELEIVDDMADPAPIIALY